MRGIALVLVIGFGAACESGVVIEVRPAPGTHPATVDLFLGLDQCFVGDQPCPGIKPPGNVQMILRGDVYHRDSNTRLTVETDDDGVARIKLEGGYVPLIVAVDDEQNAAAIARDIDLGETNRYVIQLNAAGEQLGRSTIPGTFVQIWNKQRDPKTSCIGFELWTKQPDALLEVSRYFVVPKEDPDCDDFDMSNFECNPFAYQSVGAPSIDKVSCIKGFDLGGESACRLGGPSCTDGVQGSTTCGPSEFCMPSGICLACMARTNAADLRACLGDTIVEPAGVTPRISCTLPLELAADTTHSDRCPNVANTYVFDLGSSISYPIIPAPALLPKPSMLTPMQFVDEIALQTLDAGTVRTLKFKWHHLAGKTYKVEFDGEAIKGVSVLDHAFVRFATDRGSIIVPVELAPVFDCSKQFECHIVGPTAPTEDVWRCGN